MNDKMINQGKIYISIPDLMKLIGCTKKSAYRRHKTIRDALSEGGIQKENVTIYEYCDHVKDNYCEVFLFLRGELPEFNPGNEVSVSGPDSQNSS